MSTLVNLKKYYSSPKVANKKHGGISTAACLSSFWPSWGRQSACLGFLVEKLCPALFQSVLKLSPLCRFQECGDESSTSL